MVAGSVSTGQSAHYNISPLTYDGADPNTDITNQQLTHEIPDDVNFGQWLNDFNASSGEQNLTNNFLEDRSFTMSGALPDSTQASGTIDGSEMSQGTNTCNHIEWDFSGATMVAGDQLHTANADTLDSNKQLNLHTSMMSNEAPSNPYWQTGSRVVDDFDSAMVLCDTPNSSITGADKSFLNHLPQSFMARGIAKPPARSARAVKRAEKLTAQVTKLTALRDELRAQVKGTKSENSSLRRRIEEVESEKEGLLDTLEEIGKEVDAWDLDDGEALEVDSLSDRMHRIKLLLPH